MPETYGSFSYQAPQMSPVSIIIAVIIALVVLVAEWKVFTKAGKPGWAVLIPIYNVWVLYTIICNRGTAMFRLLIPIYSIYWMIKSDIKLAHAYGKSTGFGVGLIFLAPIFMCILGFGDAKYEGPQEM